MKMFVTTVVLGAAIAWPTVGEAAAKKAKVRKASAAVAQQVAKNPVTVTLVRWPYT